MSLSEQQKKEILEQQAQKNITKRVTSSDLENILLYLFGKSLYYNCWFSNYDDKRIS